MAADAPSLSPITAAFTAAELELLERAAEGRALEAFLHRAVLETAGNLVGLQEGGMAEPEGQGPPSVPRGGTAGDEVSVLLERGARMERLLGEVVALSTTILSELYAHTAFRDAAHERECRARAEAKVARIAPAIQRLLAASRFVS